MFGLAQKALDVAEELVIKLEQLTIAVGRLIDELQRDRDRV